MKFWLLSLIIIAVSCSTSPHKESSRGPASSLSINEIQVSASEFHDRYEEFQEMVEENLVWREQVISYYNYLMDKMNKGTPLSNGDLQMIQLGTEDYLVKRNKVFELIDFIKWFSDATTKISITDGPTSITYYDYAFWRFARSDYYNVAINPNDQEGRLIIKSIKLSFAAAIILYDNYLLAIRPFSETPKLRRIIDRDNFELSYFLKEVSKNFVNMDNFDRTSKVSNFIHGLDNKNSIADKEDEYLTAILESSFTYQKIETIAPEDVMKETQLQYKKNFSDAVVSLFKNTTNEVSKIFGNSVGLIQSRKGKLLSMSNSEQQEITQSLKPLDVLLEKTPFRLTDKFIPGHWGHVAIWVGNENQLKDLDVWDELPELTEKAREQLGYKGPSFQEMIRSGHYIVEALRPGVEINTLHHFLNIDDLAVLRIKELDRETTRRFVIQAFKQIGKAYDFNFDVETDKKIVCSELAYVVFNEGFDWPTSKTAGRHTISPDNVANLAKSGGTFFPFLIYHDGKRLPDKYNQYNLERLLSEDYQHVKFK